MTGTTEFRFHHEDEDYLYFLVIVDHVIVGLVKMLWIPEEE